MSLHKVGGLCALGFLAACAAQVLDGQAASTDGGQGPASIEDSGADALATTGGASSGAASSSGGGSTSSGGGSSSSGGGHPVFEDGGAAVVGGEDGGGVDSGSSSSSSSGGSSGGCNTLSDCPYQSAPGVSGVACTNHVCVLTCNGDNYDVNGVPSDGCEFPNPCPVNSAPNAGSSAGTLCPVGHQQSAATNLGSYDCNDSDSAQNWTGAAPSDDRAHSPAVIAFDGTAGAAPVWYHIYGSGGLTCQDDLNLYMQMKSGTRLQCYSMVANTSKGPYSCQTDPTGLCQILNGSGSYNDGSDIYIEISKLDSCPATETDTGAFTVTGHL